ncbi:MAG: glycosyltransferase family 2 protein, partial [Pseudomonadales bacterium]|nr:glycosyltransferase family 2 protein [Pseudomonadales bacterium]
MAVSCVRKRDRGSASHRTPGEIEMQVAVVIPSYRVRERIVDVVGGIGPEVHRIYVIDDACPEQSGKHVREQVVDPRVSVLFNEENLGVGGAVMTGYRAALAEGADIIVKIDGDGQMAASLIPDFIAPIQAAEADYTKGNRFFNPDDLMAMPLPRLAGNAALSFLTKLSSGYWNIFDPTNGFTAIHADVLRQLPLGKIEQRYFFESDMLFRLNTVRAVVVDIPMRAVYGSESSNLRIGRVLIEFTLLNARNTLKRLLYNYFL